MTMMIDDEDDDDDDDNSTDSQSRCSNAAAAATLSIARAARLYSASRLSREWRRTSQTWVASHTACMPPHHPLSAPARLLYCSTAETSLDGVNTVDTPANVTRRS